MRICEQSHSAEKSEREGSLAFFNIHSVAKYRKIEKGPFEYIKKFLKSLLKKKRKGDPLVSSGIVSYARKRNKYYSSITCAKWYNLAP